MNETIRIEDLKIGMFVILPLSWFRHPFLRNEFLIMSQDQIDKIAACGIREIVIDTSRGRSAREPVGEEIPREEPAKMPPKTWTPEKLIPPELREAIDDKSLPPEKKSRVVYDCSRLLVERLFEDPKAENIREAKEGISEVVDLILSDDATSRELLRITSYDFSTYVHSVNVGVFSIMLSKALFRGSDGHDMHELGAGFFLHDIGKVRIDPGIINKPGRVTDEEMTIIRTHPSQGYDLLKETSQLTEECMIIVMQHHERQDGSGYPSRLKEEKIHTYSRICCIADVFDALTAERSYKRRLDTFSALKLMKEEMLSHFHREIFEKFVMLFARLDP
jgi:HD-GYP domain-containing protein (c-di-GMP phosphodiesterase class II)